MNRRQRNSPSSNSFAEPLIRAWTVVDPQPVDEDGPVAVLHRCDITRSVTSVRPQPADAEHQLSQANPDVTMRE